MGRAHTYTRIQIYTHIHIHTYLHPEIRVNDNKNNLLINIITNNIRLIEVNS